MANIGSLWIFIVIALLTAGDFIYDLAMWRKIKKEKNLSKDSMDLNLTLKIAKTKKKLISSLKSIFLVIAFSLTLLDMGLLSEMNYKIGLLLIALFIYIVWTVCESVLLRRNKRRKEMV